LQGRGHALGGEGASRGARRRPGIAAGRGKGHVFVRGHVVGALSESDMVEALVEEAERSAEQTRDELLQIQGTDANHAQEKIEKIREIVEP
jgi:(E)-4-hydroxy-3-methylbut-2-enyl-diphosphate synthase